MKKLLFLLLIPSLCFADVTMQISDGGVHSVYEINRNQTENILSRQSGISVNAIDSTTQKEEEKDIKTTKDVFTTLDFGLIFLGSGVLSGVTGGIVSLIRNPLTELEPTITRLYNPVIKMTMAEFQATAGYTNLDRLIRRMANISVDGYMSIMEFGIARPCFLPIDGQIVGGKMLSREAYRKFVEKYQIRALQLMQLTNSRELTAIPSLTNRMWTAESEARDEYVRSKLAEISLRIHDIPNINDQRTIEFLADAYNKKVLGTYRSMMVAYPRGSADEIERANIAFEKQCVEISISKTSLAFSSDKEMVDLISAAAGNVLEGPTNYFMDFNMPVFKNLPVAFTRNPEGIKCLFKNFIMERKDLINKTKDRVHRSVLDEIMKEHFFIKENITQNIINDSRPEVFIEGLVPWYTIGTIPGFTTSLLLDSYLNK